MVIYIHTSIIQQWNKKAHAQMKVYYKPRPLINFCVLFDKAIYKLLSDYNCL